MTDIQICLLLSSGSLMLLGISMASATAQYLRSHRVKAAAGARRPAGR